MLPANFQWLAQAKRSWEAIASHIRTKGGCPLQLERADREIRGYQTMIDRAIHR